MSTDTVIGFAIVCVLAQCVVVALLLKFVRTFGAYTSIVLQTHQQNMLIQQENFNLSDDLARLRADVVAERTHRYQPPQSEDCVA